MIDTLPKKYHSKIRSISDGKMVILMDTMKQRIHFYHDLNNHTYFFEEPQYDNPQAAKFLKKLTQPVDVKIKILQDINERLVAENDNEDFITADTINHVCSMYLFENKEKNYKNEDVFFLLRYAISGNPVGAPTGDIGEVIGLK